ncbi:MAG: serpin family protein [Candidatus Electrothrix sp. EH2]|nr:serpin family protein [Candidatus Electrothrix sp. EH2]
MLVNVIYFKGKWARQFDPGRTAKSDFFLSEDSKIRIPMMYQKGTFDYAKIKGAELLKLPYVGNKLSMVIILPEKVEGLSEIENRFTEKNLEAWLSRLSRQTVKVYLPKFKITWGTFDLKQPLQASGMRKAFSADADFSGIEETKNLFIGPVLHKAFVEVNEKGTKAAAVTETTIRALCIIPEPLIFKADHPFLFLIQDNVTNSILFLGRVIDPSIKNKDHTSSNMEKLRKLLKTFTDTYRLRYKDQG